MTQSPVFTFYLLWILISLFPTFPTLIFLLKKYSQELNRELLKVFPYIAYIYWFYCKLTAYHIPVLWWFSFLSMTISPGDSRGLQLYDYWSNREASLFEAQYHTGKHDWNVWLHAYALFWCINECLQYCVYINPYDDHLPDDAFHVNLAAESNWSSTL